MLAHFLLLVAICSAGGDAGRAPSRAHAPVHGHAAWHAHDASPGPPPPSAGPPSEPAPPPPSRILAHGQVRTGVLRRTTRRRALLATPADTIELADLTLEGTVARTAADLGVILESSPSDRLLFDILGHVAAELYDPPDLAAGRLRTLSGDLDLRLGLAPDLETTLRLDLLVHAWRDTLAPVTDATRAAFVAAIDHALTPTSFLTLRGSAGRSAIGDGDSGNFNEFSGEAAYTLRGPEEVGYVVLPPRPSSLAMTSGFTFAEATGLAGSRRLFPLGESSTIAPQVPDPPADTVFDRLFREKVVTRDSLTYARATVGARRHEGGPRPDFNRVAGGLLHTLRLRPGLSLTIADDLTFTAYQPPVASTLATDRVENHLSVGLARLDRSGERRLTGTHRLFVFPDQPLLDMSQIALEISDSRHFGRRYHLTGGLFLTFDRYDAPRPDFPDRRRVEGRTVFTVDFTPMHSLTLENRYIRVTTDAFASEFDSPFRDVLLGLTYRHRVARRAWLELGGRHLDRDSSPPRAGLQPVDAPGPEDRRETLGFLETVFEL